MGAIGKIKSEKNKLVGKYGKRRALKIGCSYIWYKCTTEIAVKVMRKLINKVDNKLIVFETKPDYADNGRALSDYMVTNGYNDYKIIWLVEKPERYKQYETENVKYVRALGKNHMQRTFKAYYYALKAKHVFFTHAFKWVGKKQKDQIYINLWHGCGYKASRRDPNKASDMNIFDFVLVPGEVFVKTKAEFFLCDKSKILPIGYPRYDLYKSNNANVDKYLDSLSGKGRKNILWMPTFVQSKDLIYYKNPIPSIIGLPLINSVTDLDKLEDICAKNNVNLIIKRHRIGSKVKLNENENKEQHVFYLENKDLDKMDIQLYELIAKSDALITDYSSVAIDYMILNKPLGFTLESMEDYAKTRGFVFEDPRDYMPGEHMYCFDDLEEFIKNVSKGKDLCAEHRERIMGETHNKTDDYCKRILDYFKL